MKNHGPTLLALIATWMLAIPRAHGLADGDFADADWSVAVVASTMATTASANRGADAAGGGFHLRVEQTLAGPAGLRSAHFGRRLSVRPADVGGVRTLTTSLRARVLSTEPGTFGGGVGPAVRQNGRIYAAALVPVRANPSGPLPSDYETQVFRDLPAVAYHEVTGAQEVDTSRHPDFSSAGAEMETGFYVVNSHTLGSKVLRIVAVDDVAVEPAVEGGGNEPGGTGAPQFVEEPTGLATLEGALVQISPRVTGEEPLSYRWSKDGVDLPNQRDRALVLSRASGADTGDYRLTASNARGTATSRPARVVVYPAGDPAFAVRASAVTNAAGARRPKLEWSGGIGPFTVQRASQVEGPWTVAQRTILSEWEVADFTGEGAAFFRVQDEFLPGPGQAVLGRTRSVPPVFTEGLEFEKVPIPAREGSRNPRPRPTITRGPLRGLMTPSVPATEAKPGEVAGGNAEPALAAAADPVRFARRTELGPLFPGRPNVLVLEPVDASGAASGQAAILTGNTWAAFSIDAGATFQFLDIANVFPSGAAADHGGLCCDQVVTYVPSIDRFVWVMQFWSTPAGATPQQNMLRLAVASPQDLIASRGRAWTYWDLRSQALFGFTSWFDYPDLSFGARNLFLSVAVVNFGRVVMRIPLADLAASVPIVVEYTDPAFSVGAGSAHVTEDAGDEAFWAGHLTTSEMRVWSMADAGNVYRWRDVPIQSWPAYSTNRSPAPGGEQWLAHPNPGASCIGAVRDGSRLWFAWMAGADAGFPQPHVQMVRLDAATLAPQEQVQVWNPDFAFGYPALAVNSRGELGMALGFGGGPFNATGAVGIWGDFMVWHAGLSTFTRPRWGDYLAIAPHHPDGRLFSAAVYNEVNLGAGRQFNPVYIRFGRRSVVP